MPPNPVLRNFGQKIVDDEGMLIGVKKPCKWNDLLAAVPRWFSKFGPGGTGDMASRVYSHYSSIAPTLDKGKKKFLSWLREVSEMLETPLPGAEDVS